MYINDRSQVVHGTGWPNQVGFVSKTQSPDHVGKQCEVVRAVTNDFEKYPEDKPFWDVRIGKSWVKLEDGTQIAVLNDEIS